jgi:predicted lipid-binding transport protein (Tim44 family)
MDDGGMLGGLLGGGVGLLSACFGVVIAIVATVVPIVLVIWIFKNMSKNRAVAEQLLRTGAPGQARVLTVGQTGMYVNNQPQLQIELEVHPSPEAGGYRGPSAPFRASLRTIVPMMAMAAVQPGATVLVRFDPASPGRLEIDWGSMGYMGGPQVSPF